MQNELGTFCNQARSESKPPLTQFFHVNMLLYTIIINTNWRYFLYFYFEGFTSIPTALTANDRNRRIQVYQASDG